MPKYRKKPVVINAFQWIEGEPWVEGMELGFNGGPVIKTLEGEMTVTSGDYIITGVKGERYPCKPDIFEATYDIANTARSSNPQIENNFVYHAPKQGQPEIYTEIRDKAKELAYLIDEKVPKSREQSLAITNLEQAVFWANAGIARN